MTARCAACRRRLTRPSPDGLGPTCRRRLAPPPARAGPHDQPRPALDHAALDAAGQLAIPVQLALEGDPR